MRIAVSGCAGYLGRGYLDDIESQGHSVVFIERKSDEEEEDSVYGFKYLDGVLDCVDYVVHFAGLAHQGRQTDDSYAAYLRGNTISILEIADACRRNQVKKLVYISSIAVYGDDCSLINERTTVKPITDYGKSKLAGEEVMKSILRGTETKWTILRLPMVYGLYCPGNLEKIRRVARDVGFLPLGSIEARKSIISRENVYLAISKILSSTRTGNRVYVVSDGDSVKVSQIVDEVFESQMKGSWRNVRVSGWLLGLIMKLAGKGRLWKTLTYSYVIDMRSFKKDTE